MLVYFEKHVWFRILALTCCLIISNCTIAQTAIDTLVLRNKQEYPINDYLQWLKTDQPIIPAEAFHMLQGGRGQRLAPEHAINSGFTNFYFWMTFTLRNNSASDEKLFYAFNNPSLHDIEIYKLSDTGFTNIAVMGSARPFHTRAYAYHDFVLPINVPAERSVTYLIMAERRGEIFSSKPELMSENYFRGKEQKLYTVFGIVLGILIFNIIINFFLGISLKNNIHFLYALYVCAVLCWFFTSLGLDFRYLFPRRPFLVPISQPVIGGVTMILMAQLAIVFLQLRHSTSKAYLFLNLAKWLLIVSVPAKVIIYIWFNHIHPLKLLSSNVYLIAISGVAIGMIWAAIAQIRKGFKPAWFYLAAIAYLAFSIFKTCLIILGSHDISSLISPPTNIQQGIIIETIIIFIGIIYRYNLFKKEREELQSRLADQKIEMMHRIVAAQEEERKRLAQDLHDDVGATLSTLLLHITNMPETKEWQTPFARQYCERSITISQKALSDLRHISHDLVPKDFATGGLYHVLNNKVDELNAFTDIRFWLNADGDDRLLNDIFSITIYRIINELINNIVKHSKASTANIDISMGDSNVVLIIEDDGIGFQDDHVKSGIGLKNIRSRVAFLNGSLNIDKNKQGVTVIIEIPIHK
jgi:two-component system, sensor histidine kinase LadS